MTDEFHAPEYRRRRQASMLFVAIGALVMVIAALWLWDSVRTLTVREAALTERIDLLVQRENTLVVRNEEMARSVAALSGQHGDIAARLDALQGAHRSGLLAAEAEYLVRLAAQRLALAQDPAGALSLLAGADDALKQMRDVDTHAARAALAADMARLREAGALDVESVYLRLDALPPRIDAIAAIPEAKRKRASAPAGSTATPAVVQEVPAWERLGQEIRSLVSIRRADAPAIPLVTAGERALAAQNFRLLVEQAQLALLQRRAAIYRHSLEQASAWLDRIVSGDPVARNAVRRELAALMTVRLDGGGLELTGSMAATRALAVRLLPEGRP